MADDLRKTADLEVWRLLPWLANDTLEGDDLERVLDHLKESEECRRELLFLSELRHAVELASDDRLEPSPERLDRLMTRIDRYEERRDRGAAGPSERQESRRPGGVRWLLVAQAAVLAALVGALIWTLTWTRAVTGADPGEPGFRTLSDPAAVSTPVATERLRLRLIFEGGVEERQVRGLLLVAGAEIVGGPTALGVYTVELRRSDQGAHRDFEEIVRALRGDPRVAFVERASDEATEAAEGLERIAGPGGAP